MEPMQRPDHSDRQHAEHERARTDQNVADDHRHRQPRGLPRRNRHASSVQERVQPRNGIPAGAYSNLFCWNSVSRELGDQPRRELQMVSVALSLMGSTRSESDMTVSNIADDRHTT